MLPVISILLICNERSMILFFSRKRNIIIRDAPSVLGVSWKRQLTETYHKCGAQALYSTIVLEKKNTYFSNRSTPNITLVYIAYIGLDPFQNSLSALNLPLAYFCVCVCVCFANRGQGFCRTGRKVPCHECRSRTTEIKRAKPILYSRFMSLFLLKNTNTTYYGTWTSIQQSWPNPFD